MEKQIYGFLRLTRLSLENRVGAAGGGGRGYRYGKASTILEHTVPATSSNSNLTFILQLSKIMEKADRLG